MKEAESILQALAAGEGNLEPFSAFESDSDGKYSAHSNYRRSHDTPDGPEDEESDNIPTPEPALTELEASERHEADQIPTPPSEE